ncbi:hypothetical protein MUK42_26720 [Musa troglodytarum]|uniref:Uncharacterized protein n=1 Tax=Musa troglodytarum TaxID=320322 RepID=A0A9E7F7M7_9LILI|nr:hypothetical protein MUK42_26720 [Musa troglodytarum]
MNSGVDIIASHRSGKENHTAAVVHRTIQLQLYESNTTTLRPFWKGNSLLFLRLPAWKSSSYFRKIRGLGNGLQKTRASLREDQQR